MSQNSNLSVVWEYGLPACVGVLGPSLPLGLATWGPFIPTLSRHLESGCGRDAVGGGSLTAKGQL